MTGKSLSVLMLSLLLIKVSDSNNDTFTPSKEWQTIKEGQSIPPGLHVRINLQSGKKEAKLMEEDTKQELSVLPEENVQNESKTSSAPKNSQPISNKLEEALKKIPMTTLDYSLDQLEELRRKYRTYKEIKKDFEDMKMDVKTDSEILTTLVKEYKNLTKDTTTEKKYEFILEDIHYLIHQIDNALWFIQEGGLDHVLLPMIVNQTNVPLRIKSLRILGALTQNNPKAQIKVFEKNFGSYLSQILISSANSEELSTCLYAFGGMLRKFPHAQKQILSISGTKAIISVLSRDTDLKIKAKAMTLISDLIIEKEYAINMELDPSNKLKSEQYNNVHFDNWLLGFKFCDIVVEFLSQSKSKLLVETDLTDYFSQALQTTQKMCFPVWSESPMLRHTLLTIRNRFKSSDDEYLKEIAQRLEEVIHHLYGHLHIKDEL